MYITPVFRYHARRALARALGRRRVPGLSLLLAAAGLTLLACSVRLLYVADLAPTLHTAAQPGVRMAVRYGTAAVALLEGDGILYPRVWPRPDDTGLLSRPPGYPAFLAAIDAAFGRSLTAVQGVQVTIGALLPALLLALMTRLAGFRVGLATGILAALSPALGFHCGLVTPDSVATALAVVFVLLLFEARRHPFLALAAAGLVAGFSTWLRPNLLLLCVAIAPLLPFALGRGRRALAAAAVMTTLSLAVVAPITVRNYRLFGEFVPVSSNMGIVLWEGIADAGGERFGAQRFDLLVALDEAERFADPRYGKWWASPDGVRRDRDRVRRSLEVIREHPLWFAGATLRRAAVILDVRRAAPRLEPVTPRLREDARAAGSLVVSLGRQLGPFRAPLRALQDLTVPPAGFFAAIGLALLAFLAPRRALLLLSVPLYVLAMQAPMHFESRFALPLYAFLPALESVGWTLLAVGLARSGAWLWARRRGWAASAARAR